VNDNLENKDTEIEKKKLKLNIDKTHKFEIFEIK
jgi:hypothetical protein